MSDSSSSIAEPSINIEPVDAENKQTNSTAVAVALAHALFVVTAFPSDNSSMTEEHFYQTTSQGNELVSYLPSSTNYVSKLWVEETPLQKEFRQFMERDYDEDAGRVFEAAIEIAQNMSDESREALREYSVDDDVFS